MHFSRSAFIAFAVNAMIGRQKIGSPILGNIVEQSARADVRAIIVK